MPYWRRPELLQATLDSFDKNYGSESDDFLEVIVAVDGCEAPKICSKRFRTRYCLLPEKDKPMNPCVPFNLAAEHAGGDVLVIQNPESAHTAPILNKMHGSLKQAGYRGYVIAACWDVGQGRWYAHSTRQIKPIGPVPGVPPGFQLHYCVMMHRQFWEEFGGFDEAYRDGAGYDDNDLAWRAWKAGAVPVMRDDCVVEHHRTRTGWAPHAFDINKALFLRKWRHHKAA